MASTSLSRHQRIGRIGKRGIEMLATLADSLMQGPEEFLVAPSPDARLPVGSDVGRVDRADHGQLERQAAGKGLAAGRGVAGRAIGRSGEIFAARHQIGAGEARRERRSDRALEIRKLDALAFGKDGGIAGAQCPPCARHDCQEDDRQESKFLRRVIQRLGSVAVCDMVAFVQNSMRGAIDP